MSWLKAVPSGADDVFDENADDINLLTKEWASNMKKRVKVRHFGSKLLLHVLMLLLYCV